MDDDFIWPDRPQRTDPSRLRTMSRKELERAAAEPGLPGIQATLVLAMSYPDPRVEGTPGERLVAHRALADRALGRAS